ncbi:MAG: hypothetical protein RJA70_3793 [Pseudomonadota bacterium]|jgi:hypothetical protein
MLLLALAEGLRRTAEPCTLALIRTRGDPRAPTPKRASAIWSLIRHRSGVSYLEALGFRIEVDEIRTSWELHPRATGEPLGYRGLCVGNEGQYHDLPPRLLCSEAPAPWAS